MKGFREWKLVATVSGRAGGRAGVQAGEGQLFLEVTRADGQAGDALS